MFVVTEQAAEVNFFAEFCVDTCGTSVYTCNCFNTICLETIAWIGIATIAGIRKWKKKFVISRKYGHV